MAYGDWNLLQDIAQRGSAALAGYGGQPSSAPYSPSAQALGARQQVFNAFSGAPQQSVSPGGSDLLNQLYAQWSARYNPPQRGILYGNQTMYGTGKTKHRGEYAGYNTSSDLWNAIEGKAVMDRRSAIGQAEQARTSAVTALQQLQKAYDQANSAAMAAMQKEDAARAHQPGAARYTEGPNTGMLRQTPEQAKYQTDLKNWLAARADPLAQSVEFANQVEQVPFSQYAQEAGGSFGVDPYITAGRFGAQQDVADWMTNRNLSAIENYGLPYSEVLGLQNQAADQATAAGKAQDQQNLTALEDELFSQTGTDPTQLAAEANLTVPQLAQVVADPGYQQANAALQQIVAGAQDNPDAQAQFEDTLRQIGGQDPTLYQVLLAQYHPYGASASDYFPSGG